ncbi:hypothetical protein HBH56_028750 [Parastagonospora nodorum]|uniref:Uncharacterized protein n=1 Tax=Phaeosphaeria nodorum (strain SN15 / ATCC MYA-4574 / FGSC 10173) TaxID=321614 RepID=A0A7U2F9Y3_PHANO|nr:hypothetical protein HBH56_028750 [Parastagonospora nodorum]QRC99139.1 hypothetical protein JI435_413070 [Parastagonospora nodorum SN15]KAH3934214.1 hypothetical protein HBH54_053290 [Parastagonospora nodorum]KAH4141772.1 hypothetical protein HBH45_063500 [Parastagonospora nodorum]KAH4150968.1 hypothetical protein HBH44_171800 [Parastagonospora nodorum]
MDIFIQSVAHFVVDRNHGSTSAREGSDPLRYKHIALACNDSWHAPKGLQDWRLTRDWFSVGIKMILALFTW